MASDTVTHTASVVRHTHTHIFILKVEGKREGSEIFVTFGNEHARDASEAA